MERIKRVKVNNVGWNWILIAASILINIVSIVVLLKWKKLQNESQKMDNPEVIQESIESFVAKIEKENDALYQKLVHYTKLKEAAVEVRLRALEEKMDAGGTNVSLVEQPIEDVIQPKQPSDKDQEEDKISQLYKQGFSPKQIAKVLQMDYGKVEVIINMLNKRQSYSK